jgi:hypothetical protein
MAQEHIPSVARVWPEGRWRGVPDTTTLDERPWYPTGMYSLESNKIMINGEIDSKT